MRTIRPRNYKQKQLQHPSLPSHQKIMTPRMTRRNFCQIVTPPCPTLCATLYPLWHVHELGPLDFYTKNVVVFRSNPSFNLYAIFCNSKAYFWLFSGCVFILIMLFNHGAFTLVLFSCAFEIF